MKILDWIKKLLTRTKRDNMLNEGIETNYTHQEKKEFIPKVDITNVEHKKTREDIFRNLNKDIIIEDLSEQYNYDKFSPENIRKKYDTDSILSAEDMTTLSCIYGAIKDGNMSERRTSDNKINIFLKKNPNNIITLVTLIQRYAKNEYDKLKRKSEEDTEMKVFIPDSYGCLVPGSYSDISKLIDEYEQNNSIDEIEN